MANNSNMIEQRPDIFVIGVWLVMFLGLIFLTPTAHTRLTPDAYPQSPRELSQALSKAIETKQLEQAMRLFNWENVAAAEAIQIKSLWQQAFRGEDLVKVEIIPFYRDFDSENQRIGYYRYMIDEKPFYSNLFIDGEVRLTFKTKQPSGGFSSASIVSLPYGELTPANSLQSEPSWQFANRINDQMIDE